MNAKVYIVGLGGGVLVTGALLYPLYLFFPGLIVRDWPTANAILAGAFGLLALLLLLGTGAAAARLGGLRGKRGAAASGGVAGGIAALLAYMFIISPAVGEWANLELLTHGLRPAQDNPHMIALLVNAVVSVVQWSQFAIWFSILIGLLAGALAGVAAGAAGTPGNHLGVLAVPMSIAGMLSAVWFLLVSIETFRTLSTVTQNAANRVNYTGSPYPIGSMLTFASISSFLYLLFWQFLAWLAVRRASRGAAFRPISWDVCGWVDGLMPVILYLSTRLVNDLLSYKYPTVIIVGFLLSAGMSVLALRTLWRLHRVPRLPERRPLAWRWFLAGALVLLSLALAGAYVAGSGPAINLVTMVASFVPALVVAHIQPYATLAGLLQAHYLVPLKVLLYSVPVLLILIVLLTAFVIPFDRAHPIYLFFRNLFVRRPRVE
jgi:hypothetical protein